MRAALLVLPLALILAGCQTGPQVVEATSPTVTLRANGATTAELERRAEEECGKYGLEPSLVDSGRQGGDRVFLYQCL